MRPAVTLLTLLGMTWTLGISGAPAPRAIAQEDADSTAATATMRGHVARFDGPSARGGSVDLWVLGDGFTQNQKRLATDAVSPLGRYELHVAPSALNVPSIQNEARARSNQLNLELRYVGPAGVETYDLVADVRQLHDGRLAWRRDSDISALDLRVGYGRVDRPGQQTSGSTTINGPYAGQSRIDPPSTRLARIGCPGGGGFPGGPYWETDTKDTPPLRPPASRLHGPALTGALSLVHLFHDAPGSRSDLCRGRWA